MHDNADSRSAQKQQIGDFISDLSSLAVIETGRRLADLDFEKRQMLIDLFGRPAAESIAFAALEDAVLWTDDLAVAEIAQSEFGVKRVWSQQLFYLSMVHEDLSREDFNDLTLFLLQWRYCFTRLYVPTILQAGKRTHWNPDAQPLKSVLDWFRQKEITGSSLLQLCAEILRQVTKVAPLIHQRENTIRALIHSILRRPDGEQLAREFREHCDDLFGIDVVNAEECKRWIRDAIEGLVL